MGQIEVFLEVPAAIEQGLMLGQLDRVGGVIVETHTRQVVAWLRDGQAAVQTPETVSGLAHQLNKLTAVSSVALLTGQALNLALTAATSAVIMQRLDHLSANIALLHTEITRVRERDFRIALGNTSQLAYFQDEVSRKQKSITIIESLEKLSRDYLDAFVQQLKDDKSDEEKVLQLAQYYLTCVVYAETAMAQCYLHVPELEVARRGLQSAVNTLYRHVIELARRILSRHIGLHLHPIATGEHVKRAFEVVRRLKKLETGEPVDDFFVVLDEFRRELWDMKAVDTGLVMPFSNPEARLKERIAELEKRLMWVDTLLENYDRLRGFDLELRSMRLSSFDQWRDYADAGDHDLVMLVDLEQLEALRH